MDAKYTSAIWMNASFGVGVAAQRITISTMKYFIAFLGYTTFVVLKGESKKLAERSVPPIVCTNCTPSGSKYLETVT
jgi:hypothetical protein